MIPITACRMVTALAICLWSLATGSVTLAAPPAIDPCKLLTPAEVEQVVGKLKSVPTSETLGDGVRCGYDFADEKNEFEIWASAESWTKVLRKDAKKPVMVKGLGDEAFVDRGKGDPEAVDLYIKKGDKLLILLTRKCPGDEEKLKTLGRKAIGRL